MRRWRHIEPTSGSDSTPVVIETTETEIATVYFPSWRERMRAVGKAEQVSIEACIEDWIVVHWAQLVAERKEPT